MKKFNPKEYEDKERIFKPVSGYSNISKLWTWNAEKLLYEVKAGTRPYQARKKVLEFGKRKRVTKYFETLEQALNWQHSTETQTIVTEAKTTFTFSDLLAKWKLQVYSKLKITTQTSYDKIISSTFEPLLPVSMDCFNGPVVDDWIDYLLKLPRTHRRHSYDHEIDLLTAILNFYREYKDGFVSPIRKRHKKALKLKDVDLKRKDLNEAEFLSFRRELEKLKHGRIFSLLATVQYYQALRISEAAALHWEDIQINDISAHESRLVVSKSLKWLRVAGAEPILEFNFKNSKGKAGPKEQPLFHETYAALIAGRPDIAKGPMFRVGGEFLSYRQIQHVYDCAFLNAGLPFTGTHIMRHGGCRRVFNSSGELALAQQVLGNKDMRSVLVYAQRHTNALNEYAKAEWQERDLATNGYSEPEKIQKLKDSI